MAFRQTVPAVEEIVPEVKASTWVPDLSAQKGLFGRLATLVLVYPRTSFVVTAAILVLAFLVLAPILVAAFYVLLGAGAYALWSRIKRLRMPRVIPLSHSTDFQLQKPRQDLTSLVMMDLLAGLFAGFGGIMYWQGSDAATGGTIAVAFGALMILLTRMVLRELRGRLYFQ